MRNYYLDGMSINEDDISFENIKLAHITDTDVTRDWESLIHDASSKFWSQTLRSQDDANTSVKESEMALDTNITLPQVIRKYNTFFSNLAKENNVQKIIKNYGEGYFSINLKDFSEVYLNIDLINQSFYVFYPDCGGHRDFTASQWKLGLAWLNECVKSSFKWEAQKKSLEENFYINAKLVLIAITSLKTLVKNRCAIKGYKYAMVLYFFECEIIFETKEQLCYYIKFYNKPFMQNTNLLISFLHNPHEEEIKDKICCRFLGHWPENKKEYSFSEYRFFTIKECVFKIEG